MKHGLDSILLAVAVIVSCTLLGLLLLMNSMGKGYASKANEGTIAAYTSISESTATQYTGENVTGSEVQYAIEKLSKNLAISIKTEKSGEYFTVDEIKANSLATTKGIEGMDYTAMYDSDSKYYVPANAVFAGKLRRDGNRNITGITYVQQDGKTASTTSTKWVSSGTGTTTFTELTSANYKGNVIRNFLQVRMKQIYDGVGTTFSVNLVSGGKTVFLTQNSSSNAIVNSIANDTKFKVTVKTGNNNNVYLSIEELKPSIEEAMQAALAPYDITVSGTHYNTLVRGSKVLEILKTYVNKSVHSFSVTNTGGTVTYNANNPYVDSSLSYAGMVDSTGIYVMGIEGANTSELKGGATNTGLYSNGYVTGKTLKDMFNNVVVRDSAGVVQNIQIMLNGTIVNTDTLGDTQSFKLVSIDYDSSTGFVSRLYFTN